MVVAVEGWGQRGCSLGLGALAGGGLLGKWGQHVGMSQLGGVVGEISGQLASGLACHADGLG